MLQLQLQLQHFTEQCVKHSCFWIDHLQDYCPHVHDTNSYSQEPINCNDKSDVISGKSYRGQYNHHGDQACLWDASSSNTGCSGCNTEEKHTGIHRWKILFIDFRISLYCLPILIFFYLMVMIWPKFISILLTWAMKMAASASYRAVPSMLMVAPTGSTKRVIRLSILLFSSRHLKVTGRVAELGKKELEQFEGTVINYCWVYEWLFSHNSV